MKKNKEVILPDYTDKEVLVENDLVLLGDMILEKLRQQIGTTELYLVCKGYNNEYCVTKVLLKDIYFSNEHYGSLTAVHFNHVYKTIVRIYKDEEKAKEFADNCNVEFIQRVVTQLKKDIDDINPIKILEDAENKRKDLMIKYEKEKEKLNSILEKQNLQNGGTENV